MTASAPSISPRRGFHVMAKPIGPVCNLKCAYCFYLEKTALHPLGERYRMSDAVLESYIRQHLAAQPGDEVLFAWQGGEPTLLGVDFFRRVVDLEKRYAEGRRVANAIQTNGVLLDEVWGEFLAREKFLVGISVDGPRAIHNRYRVEANGRPSFDRVMAGIALLKKHGVEFNTLTVVGAHNSRKPLEVYRFLKENGSGFLQFIPLVERLPNAGAETLGLDLATPPEPGEGGPRPSVTPWSVTPADYGEFLVAIFEDWIRQDVGRVFVQLFDVTLGIWTGQGSGLCVFAEECGHALALEHNGDLYACDHYVYPAWRRGNLLETPLAEMVHGEAQRRFGAEKRTTLPRFCRECDVRFACNGECPKHRFLRTPDGEGGLNYLCAAYRRFFRHVAPAMETMARLLRAGRAPAEIIEIRRAEERRPKTKPDARCLCGSGRKHKNCCGKTRASA